MTTLYSLGKRAAEVSIKPRRSPVIHSLLDQVVLGPKERAPAGPEDTQDWQRIADYMTAAAPSQLGSLKVYGGGVDEADVLHQIEKHRGWDAWPEKIQGNRDLIAQSYANLPPMAYEQMPESYHHTPNAVFSHVKSPGVLIHELGHGVDLGKHEGQSNFRTYLRRNLKPSLWKELSAWKKGRKAYQAGFAASGDAKDPELLKKYEEAMDSYNARKYPAYGTYLGGAAGATAGLAAPAIAGALSSDPGLQRLGQHPYIMGLGAALGGLAGVYAGGAGGRLYAHLRKNRNRAKALRQFKDILQRKDLKQIQERLQAIRQRRETPAGPEAAEDKPTQATKQRER